VGHLQVVIYDSRVSYTMCGVILCYWGLGGGTRSRYYTSEYHELTYVYIYCYGYVTVHVPILVLFYLVVAEISVQILMYYLPFCFPVVYGRAVLWCASAAVFTCPHAGPKHVVVSLMY
jgi:hypothetical protein